MRMQRLCRSVPVSMVADCGPALCGLIPQSHSLPPIRLLLLTDLPNVCQRDQTAQGLFVVCCHGDA